MQRLNIEAWSGELKNDPDEAFLLNGVINGFSIVNVNSIVVPAEVSIHPSASPGSDNY